MATLNIRVEDHVRDALQDLANSENLTLSEFVRNLLREAAVPIRDEIATKHGDSPVPESLTIGERQTLALLHRILGRVLPEGSNDLDGDLDYQLERAHVLEQGFTGEYWKEVAGFATELSKRDSRRVNDILEMFRVVESSIERLSRAGTPVDPDMASGLTYQGFDFNDSLEGHMASYVEHLVETGRWQEVRPYLEQDNGNSHMPMLDVYTRMLSEYRRIMDSRDRHFSRNDYFLSIDELISISEKRRVR